MKAEIYTNDLGTDILEEDIPAEYLEQAQEYREKLVEAVAETDEDLMMKYLEGEEITTDELKAAIREKQQSMLNSSQYCVVQPSRTRVFS